MLEVGGGSDLGQESFRADDRTQLGPQDLERDVAVVAQVLSQVNRRHTAHAELSLDAVPTG
jgi:hypothetical protein